MSYARGYSKIAKIRLDRSDRCIDVIKNEKSVVWSKGKMFVRLYDYACTELGIIMCPLKEKR